LSAAVLIVVSQDVRERWRGDIRDVCPVTARSSRRTARECLACGRMPQFPSRAAAGTRSATSSP